MTVLEALVLKARFEWWAPLRAGRHPALHASHSQFGEDMVLRSLFGDRRTGTYVDIGAHHPVYYSNTYHFYRRGWRGLNVDAAPGSMDPFAVLRPNDINIEACIAPVAGVHTTLFVFEDAALTTTHEETARRQQTDGRRLKTTVEVECVTLVECLDRHLQGRHIDLLSLDVEGADEGILRSHDWARYAPDVLVFERHGLSIENAGQDDLLRFLRDTGYVIEGKCGPSLVMRRIARSRM